MKNNIIGLIILVLIAFTACDKDVTDPVASFEADETTVEIGQEIEFSLTGAADFWVFFPGEANTEVNVEEETFRYTYSTPGIYNAKMIASNVGGENFDIKRDSAFIQITVTDDADGIHTSFSEYKFVLKKVFEGFEDKTTLKLYIDGRIVGNEVTVEVPNSTKVEALNAIYVIPGSSIAYIGNVEQRSGLVNDFTNPVVYRIVSNDGTEVINTVTMTKLPISDDSGLLSFDLSGLPVNTSSVTKDGNSFEVVLSDSAALEDVKSKFTIHNFARAFIDGVEQKSDNTKADYSAGVDITVKAEDGSESVYEITILYTPNINRFYFGEGNTFVSEGYYNATKDTIFVDAPSGSNLSALKASYVSRPFDSEVKIGAVVQESGVTVNDFSSAVLYSLGGDVDSEIVVKVLK